MFLFEKPQPKRIKEGDVTLKVFVLHFLVLLSKDKENQRGQETKQKTGMKVS